MDIVALFLVLGTLLAVTALQGRISQSDRRVARVERKLDLILDHLGLREDDPRLDEIAALARDGRKIQAIKMYREVTGAGLKEAKDAVERLG